MTHRFNRTATIQQVAGFESTEDGWRITATSRVRRTPDHDLAVVEDEEPTPHLSHFRP